MSDWRSRATPISDPAASDWRSRAEPVPADGQGPYRSPDAAPTDEVDALAGHAADNIPFMKQLGAAMAAAKMKAEGSKMDFGENYKQLLLAEQRQLDKSKAESPTLSRIGAGAGFVGTAAALPGSGVKGLMTLGGMLGLSDATANPENSLGRIGFQTGASALAAPLVGSAVEKVAVPLVSPVARLAGRGIEATGNSLADLAGWLKVNSIHPTPKLGAAMEDIPGGKSAIGLELLQRGVGGLTKGATAEQAAAAKEAAGQVMGQIADKYDAGGGAPIDLNGPLSAGLQYASKLQAEPTTRAAGDRLEQLIYDYAQKYQGKPVPASEALSLKRALAAEAYKQGVAAKSGETLAGDYGAGVGKLERSVDDALDSSLGPEFGGANLSFRRLLKASSAAEAQAGRATANHVIGLMPLVAGGAGYQHGGGPEAAITGLGALLLQKYGAQAGARSAYGAGRGLQMLGLEMAPFMSSRVSPAAVESMEPVASGSVFGSFGGEPAYKYSMRPTRSATNSLASMLAGLENQ